MAKIPFADVVAHVRAAVDAAPLETAPFPHLVIDELFPPALYRVMLGSWPDEALFKATNARTRLELSVPGKKGLLPDTQHDFWSMVGSVVGAANQRAHARLSAFIDLKWAPILGPDWRHHPDVRAYRKGSPGCHLANYRSDQKLAPHTDHITVVTNAFTYMSESAREEPDLGTVVYRSHGVALPSNIILDTKDWTPYLRKVKVVPYKANRCFAFLNTPLAFHGVEPLKLGERRRRLLMFSATLARMDLDAPIVVPGTTP